METTLCYIEESGNYLMLLRNRKEHDVNAGKWIGVGGKLEPGESPEECVRREVYEETGFSLADLRLRGRIAFRSAGWEPEDMHLYTAALAESDVPREPAALPECPEGELAWVPKGEIPNLNLWEGDRFFLRELIAQPDSGPLLEMSLEYEGDALVSAKRKMPDGRVIDLLRENGGKR